MPAITSAGIYPGVSNVRGLVVKPAHFCVFQFSGCAIALGGTYPRVSATCMGS